MMKPGGREQDWVKGILGSQPETQGEQVAVDVSKKGRRGIGKEQEACRVPGVVDIHLCPTDLRDCRSSRDCSQLPAAG